MTMDDAQEYVQIEWQYRTVSVGSYYKVEILGRDGSWYVEDNECDGRNETIVSQS